MADAVPDLADWHSRQQLSPSGSARHRATRKGSFLTASSDAISLISPSEGMSQDQRRVSNEQRRASHEQRRISHEQRRISHEQRRVSTEQQQQRKSREFLPEVPPQAGSSDRVVAPTARELVKAKLEHAELATAADKDHLSAANKGDIYTVKVLGEGAFGIVDLVVVDTPKGSLLCVRKKLLKQNDMNNQDPGQEVEVMDLCNGSNFVVQMLSHVVGLYDYTLLLEYCPYNTLWHLLTVVNERRSKSGNGCMDFVSHALLRMQPRAAGLSEAEARFYTACVALGLQSMHSKGVLHRDLKPANCLLGHDRYLKLADLGLAKVLGPNGRGYTKAGTPGYMAPEVFHTQGKSSGGYSYQADLWSLGIMVWEMVDGVLPKWAYLSWYWTSLHFPDHFSKELKSLLTGLLEKSPADRMTIDQLQAHSWFAGLDWGALAKQELQAPTPPELLRVHIHGDLLPEHKRASLLLSQKQSSLYAAQ